LQGLSRPRSSSRRACGTPFEDPENLDKPLVKTSRAYAVHPSLSDVPVLVSGGGIGEAIVRAFAGQNARVGFLDIGEPKGQALVEALRGDGRQVAFERCDVTDIAAYKRAIARVEVPQRGKHGSGQQRRPR
jgi:hypothetical protein